VNARVPINALGITIKYPQDLIEVVGVSKQKSFLDLWTEDTAIREEAGEVHFSGGTTAHGGLLGTSTAITLTIEAKKPGTATISFEDVEALPYPPRCLNSKPSRFGTLERLFTFYARCEAAGIALYGGGQFELGPGRGQIQLLASLYHPDGPNDTAPAGYNAPEPVPGLETSPLEPHPAATGFRRVVPES
jgi:hypothetical protein